MPVPAERSALRYEAGDPWADAMFATLDRHGRWATGWRYSVGEGGIGSSAVGAGAAPATQSPRWGRP